MKTIVRTFLIIVVLMATMIFINGQIKEALAAEKGTPFQVNLATTSAESGTFPWAVGLSQVINKYVDQVSCKTIAIGGAGLTIPYLIKGQANFVTNVGSRDAVDIYHGERRWAKLGKVDFRLLCIREFGYIAWYVTKKSGVTNVMDLKGKKINPGPAGSVAALMVDHVEAALKIGAKWQLGSIGKAKKGIKDKRLVGYLKTSPGIPLGKKTYGMRFASSAIDVNSVRPLTIALFTDEQVEKIQKMFPKYARFWSKIPAGAIKELPGLPATWQPTMSTSGMYVMANVPIDVQYRIIKAVDEHWKDIVAASYPACAQWDPIESTINLSSVVPLAAGFVKYAKEKGVEIPAELIPPEYH